ncbi:ubiquinol-cytochrome c reductase iron-sulfur subunit [Marinomonas balearica]|uniref:Ubiquinol-cytochrome c reductase iron-sulfur subunit n=1 Tax=Marinomonas balearica TaxID=491947 RepID=A0A4R6MF38_9GAMM|nr:ubiquinol-cytochrome c reductase iron-sulfur subunit [Marinomonas balearica]TDO99905.1 ubiquinol-cytochrome c reductase iron-sulfur subunit [Marinomonas balearica]
MSRHLKQSSRRRFLVGATGVMGAAGVVGVATPFVCSLAPNEKAKQVRAPIKVDVSKIEVGAMVTVAWNGLPIWILKRDKQSLLSLKKHEALLADPDSIDSIQPKNTKNTFRSVRSDIAVYIGLCTHLGCTPKYRPELSPIDLGENWHGGFFCPCHGSKFDLAGRVYKNVPAPTNLEIPPYRFIDNDLLEIGYREESEGV